jgi:HD-GYP domain-containing protein (c-di-GMP phosphodiesterase class II)
VPGLVSLSRTGARAHGCHSLASDDVVSERRIARTGVALVVTISVAIALYALLTWDKPHRGVLIAIAAVGVAEGLVLWRAGVRLLRRLSDPEPLIALWCAAGIAVSALLCCLDDGISSPLGTTIILLVTFSAVAVAPRLTIAVAVTAILALAVVAAIGPRPESWLGFLLLRVAGLVVTAGVCAAIAGDRLRRIGALRDSQEELPRRLARVVEFRDRDTGDHVGRMSDIAGLIARELGLDARTVRRLRQASVMHDVGKVAIPDAILLKPGRLTAEERRVMEGHARAGFEMLTGSASALLELGATIALTHHERFDGTGYPDGLAGEDIPLVGRITAVADVFDALISDRVYKAAMPVDAAVATIVEGRGSHFDPAVVDVFLRTLPEIASAGRAEPADAAVVQLAG